MGTLDLGFFDRAQPEYLFTQFFGLEIQAALIKETNNQFLLKAPLFILLFVLFRFFVMELPISIIGLILTTIFLYIVVYLSLAYMHFVNRAVKANGMLGIIVSALILFVLVLVI